MPTVPAIRVPIVGEDRTARAIRSAEKNIRGLSRTTKTVMGTLGVGIGVTTFTRMASQAVQYGSALTDAATATNTHVEALQALRFAAQEAGASEQQLDMALVRAQKSAVDAANGLSTYTRAFDALGINVQQFMHLPTERKLEMIAQSMRNADDQQRAYSAAMDILGTRNAPRLMEVLQRLSSEGFEGISESARKAGQVMSGETAQAMDELADAMAALNTQSKNFFAGLAVEATSKSPWKTEEIKIAALANEIRKIEDLRQKSWITGGGEAAARVKASKELLKQGVDPEDVPRGLGLDEMLGMLRTQLDLRKGITEEEKRASAEKKKQLELLKKEELARADMLAHIQGLPSTPMAGLTAEDAALDEMAKIAAGGTSSSTMTASGESLMDLLGLSGGAYGPSPAFSHRDRTKDYIDRRYHGGHLYRRMMEDKERAAGTLPGSELSGAADSVENSADRMVQFAETLVQAFEQVSQKMDVLEQQVENAR